MKELIVKMLVHIIDWHVLQKGLQRHIHDFEWTVVILTFAGYSTTELSSNMVGTCARES